EADPLLSVDELFGLLQKGEIGQIFQLGTAEKSLRKAAQLEALRPRHEGQRRYSGWGCTDQAYRILAQPLCDRLRLIFFGNYYQDWTEFVLSDLGIYQYEKVAF